MTMHPGEQTASDRDSKLRVGIYVDGLSQPAWVHCVITDLAACSFAHVVLVMLADHGPGPTAVGSSRALAKLYTSADRRAFGTSAPGKLSIGPTGDPASRPDASATVDIGGLVAAVPTIEVHAGRGSCRLSDDDEDVIRSHDLDVALSFVPNSTLVSQGPIARCGMWSYRYGDGQGDNLPPGFWEVLTGSPITSIALELTVEGTGESVEFYRSFSSTDKYSVTRNDNVLWTSSAFVMRLLRRIRDGSLPPREELVRQDIPLPRSPGRPELPGNLEMARLLASHGLRIGTDRLRHRFLPERWMMAYSFGPRSSPLRRFELLRPPEQREWADPFPVFHAGKYILFFEEQNSPGAPAHISIMSLGDDGTWDEPTPIIVRDYHLSYPFVFMWDGCWYMIPESQAVNRVELYRCVDFPNSWVLDRVLIEGIRGVDATVIERDGVWWMFVNNAQAGAYNWEELLLYSAPAPIGPWTPHEANPARVDARDTRCAGRIFDWHGRLIRPAQDCGERYGRAIRFNEILRLDQAGLEERQVAGIEPGWDPMTVCVHTYNVAGELTVIDCLRRELRVGGSL